MSNRPATDRQKDLLMRRGVRFEEPLDLERASELIQKNRPLCTDRQREVLESMGHHVPEGLTVGEAFEIIEYELKQRKEDPTPKQIAFIKSRGINFSGILTRAKATELIGKYCSTHSAGWYEDDGWDDGSDPSDWYDPNDGLTFDDLC